MASRSVKVPDWQLTAYRMALPLCLVGMTAAACIGKQVDPVLFAILATAFYRMASGLLKFPVNRPDLVPETKTTKQIEDKEA